MFLLLDSQTQNASVRNLYFQLAPHLTPAPDDRTPKGTHKPPPSCDL